MIKNMVQQNWRFPLQSRLSSQFAESFIARVDSCERSDESSRRVWEEEFVIVLDPDLNGDLTSPGVPAIGEGRGTVWLLEDSPNSRRALESARAPFNSRQERNV